MPMQHDQQRKITQGWGSCRPAGANDFTKCFIVLDRSKQLLICYKHPQTASPIQDSQAAHHSKWPVLISFKTDNISLVEEANKNKKQQYCFAVHSLAKVTLFAAESWKDMEEWIDCIKDSSKIPVDRACLNPHRVSIVGSYTTEIVGGKVIQTPILQQIDEANTSTNSNDLSAGSLGSSSSDHPSSDSIGSQILRTGHVVKQGAMMKNWKRRFLTLTNDELTYAKNEFSGKTLKRIPLQQIKDVQVSQGELSAVRSNLIEIVTTDRTFYMQFDSMDEMFGWVEDIRKAVNLPVRTYL